MADAVSVYPPLTGTVNVAFGPVAVCGEAVPGPLMVQVIVPADVVALALITPPPASIAFVICTIGGVATAMLLTFTSKLNVMLPALFDTVTDDGNVPLLPNVNVGFCADEVTSFEPGTFHKMEVGPLFVVGLNETVPAGDSDWLTWVTDGWSSTTIVRLTALPGPLKFDAIASTV